MEQARTFGSFMEAVERETPLHFVFSTDRVDLRAAVQLDTEAQSLGEMLEQVSAQTGHSFRQIRERVIVVPAQHVKMQELEKGEVRGRVFDAVSGEP
ncbi:TonB-dependent receptor plug, partial [Nitritalea halalkaliphila LW7]